MLASAGAHVESSGWIGWYTSPEVPLGPTTHSERSSQRATRGSSAVRPLISGHARTGPVAAGTGGASPKTHLSPLAAPP